MNNKETRTKERLAIRKWIFWNFNAGPEKIAMLLTAIAGNDYDRDHLERKLEGYGNDFHRFWCECDITLRNRMTDWVIDNYNC